jgi:NADH-quinone oxidoreductase subunit J
MGRHIVAGVAACIAAAAVGAAWLVTTFGRPMPDTIGTIMFWLFAAGTLVFGTITVTQRNPARGAIAFAFVILNTCGLFLLLAAPFLMAATVIIYAGAIIVTFLFVLILSNVASASDENDRSREPLLGSLAGFAFVGLILFTLHATQQSVTAAEPQPGVAPRALAKLPAPVLTPEERKELVAASAKLDEIAAKLDTADLGTAQARAKWMTDLETDLEPLRRATVSVIIRLRTARGDGQAVAVTKQAEAVQNEIARTFTKLEGDVLPPNKLDVGAAKTDLRAIRDTVVLLNGSAELPARNVANLGFLLYTDHLLAVELSGTLLLVATIGAVAIAHRKGSAGA